MSKIKLRRHHYLSDQERAAALDDLSAYLQDLQADVIIEGDQLTFSGRGYNGAVTISPGMAEGYISLGLLARPFKRQTYAAAKALTLAFSRLLCRAALFFSIIPLLTILSMTGTASA